MSKVIHSLLSICLILQFYILPVHADHRSVRSLDSLVHDLKEIRAGIAVYNLTKGEYLYRSQEHKSFVPASVHKLIISAATLDSLGSDYRYKTGVYALGPIKKGVLEGDLLVKGYGDPSLTELDLRTIGQQLKKDIREIHGRILTDDSYFDSVRLGRGWTWDDERWYYSAPIGALSVERNRVKMIVKPGVNIASIHIEPKTNYVQMENLIKLEGGVEKKLQFERPYHSNHIKVFGSLGRKAGAVEEELSINEPALFVGSLLRKQLGELGIKVTKDVQKVTHAKGDKPLLVHYSKPLSELVRHLNKESDNFYAEMFLKTLGATVGGEGSFTAGLEVVQRYLERMGIPKGYQLADGSGLSRYNLITPDQMVTLLRQIQRKPYHEVFEESLPYAGVDGTMRRRLMGTPAMGNLHAKTGSMSGVSSLAGYVKAANGDKLAFCIFTNGDYHIEDARVFQDQVVHLLTHYPNVSGFEKGKGVGLSSGPMAARIDPILDQEGLKQVMMGVIIQSIDKGKVLYARNAEKLFTPVATTKLLLSRAALRTLGRDYRFKTEMYWDKKNLFIKGYGDPSLKIHDLDSLVSQLKAKGIRNIQGDLVLDEGYFNDVRYPWGWSGDEEDRGDHAETSAIAIEEGSVTLHYEAGRYPGAAAIISNEPKTDMIKLHNQTTTSFFLTDHPISFRKERGTNHVVATGSISWMGFEGIEKMAVHDPALYFGTILKKKLEDAGILVNPTSRIRKGSTPKGDPKIAEIKSKPLIDLITYMLRTNNNHYAEMLTKALGAFTNHHSQEDKGSTTAGLQQIYKLVSESGVDHKFDLYDGSGVSHYNQLSPEQLLVGVDHRAGGASGENNMEGILPKLGPGVRGLYSEAEGRSSFSGVVTNAVGERFAVVLLFNGYVKDTSMYRKAQQQILDVVRGG
ncbi:MAG TPA: D-alanyl-D-alanine carboxypeptidase/D-alanyl-D-alanine-endopeptidase [Bacillota bacterium]|nr:D-alanyl-D-alanine carboxypeptidase/D-alanyl-D-alanine-endopeptidase [Bacillota bacterium]